MKSLVDSGQVPGLIGYKDGRPIGWISLGPREDYRRLERSLVAKRVDDKPVWSIVCFFVDPKERGKGVMEALLKGAIDYARSQAPHCWRPIPSTRRNEPIPIGGESSACTTGPALRKSLGGKRLGRLCAA